MKNQKPFVLIVEDAAMQRHLYGLLANRIGINAHLVTGCEGAMDALEVADFDLILVDWVMPNRDGLECQQLFREKLLASDRPVPPIICITAKAMDGDREICLAAGMDDYLAKPFTIEQLQAVLDQWLPMKYHKVKGVHPAGETVKRL